MGGLPLFLICVAFCGEIEERNWEIPFLSFFINLNGYYTHTHTHTMFSPVVGLYEGKHGHVRKVITEPLEWCIAGKYKRREERALVLLEDGKWWYGVLAGSSVTHCLSGLSLSNCTAYVFTRLQSLQPSSVPPYPTTRGLCKALFTETTSFEGFWIGFETSKQLIDFQALNKEEGAFFKTVPMKYIFHNCFFL